MKKNRLSLVIAALVAMTSSGTALAVDLNVNFTANVRETTCDMKLVGGVGTDTEQSLQIGSDTGIRIADLGSSAASANFSLAIVECPASLTSLKTTIKGSKSGQLPSGIINSLAKGTGVADYIAVTIARSSEPTKAFVINSTTDAERLVWTKDEIGAGTVPLIATMKATDINQVKTGTYEGIATFEFSYE
ncbi:TPA: fimbrial protein [Salmonella enterica subsp. salamae serovar 28:r:e,n,z15]|nr:fimbrial protein [Salmonella enterica subsp. salamae serovar 28:r:e,n,z15]